MKTPVSSAGFNWELAPLQLGGYQKRVEEAVGHATAEARALAREGKKDKAMMALKKRKAGRCKLHPITQKRPALNS